MHGLDDLLKYQIENECSDLHLITEEPPFLRVKNGELQAFPNSPAFPKEVIESIIKEIGGEVGLKKFQEKKEFETSKDVAGLSRFRITCYEETRGPAIAIRAIPFEIPNPEEVGIPSTILDLALRKDGLILVTGPNGAGKTTTLASIIQYINENRKCHIITIEDPIEFTYKRAQSIITQRAVGLNTESFAEATKHAIRQDVDVIVIGEMRDLETIRTAITLAETGHIVFGTLHTDDAPRSIQRIVDVFPAEQQGQIASQLSHSLSAVMSQRLLPRKDGDGRVCVREMMLMNSGIRHAIREQKISELYSQIQINGEQGMWLFDDHLLDYVKKDIIDPKQALHAAHDPNEMKKKFTDWGIEIKEDVVLETQTEVAEEAKATPNSETKLATATN